jgi:hypothetical protein
MTRGADEANENLEGPMSLVLIVDDQPAIRELLIPMSACAGKERAGAAFIDEVRTIRGVAVRVP